MAVPCKINQNFFKFWSPKMAYILGYFAADGCMFKNSRGAFYVEFTSIDKDLIYNVKVAMGSGHKIGTYKHKNSKWKDRYRIQIGSKIIFQDLIRIGFCPAKSKIIKFPKVPVACLPDFIRGYFDGDGHVVSGVYKRSNRKSLQQRVFSVRFTSGSKDFLEGLRDSLWKHNRVEGGSIFKKRGNCFELSFSTRDALRLFSFMYRVENKGDSIYYLERKHRIFIKAIDCGDVDQLVRSHPCHG